MAEDPKEADEPTPEQVRRAEALRREIEGLGSGARRPPRTPRELTDEAAREQWERDRGDQASSDKP